MAIPANSAFKRVGLIAKPNDRRVEPILLALFKLLRWRGVDIALDNTCADILQARHLELGSRDRGNSCELFITIGGDGTLLHAAHMRFDYEVRLLGINLGKLGFLADISPEEVNDRLGAILDGHYIDEKRTVLRCTVLRGAQNVARFDAINDTVIHHWNIARLIRLDTHINGTFVHSQRSDGIIIATPTGSTAYALSGGGPILHPSLDAILLVPVCPHTLSNRPIVVGGNSRIEIVVGTEQVGHARLTCDGDEGFDLAPQDRVIVERSDPHIHLIHPANHDYYATLRAKLNWG
ncbi:MAG: NAD(+) kinase [Gammaproteobacteria bacterium]